ncbi:hypothetical protein NA57DRAFT_72287 [Rhizodiscina lignyota]|uniref:Uncharacterized protein n=1 Tax=Rhizodiscina lignyota TaxID=1504668 RepID=A0A9P4IKN3_9PEZI|nr:hypothetical protein NA57DRAFT_72287 [Rhizodiscina lignyota]
MASRSILADDVPPPQELFRDDIPGISLPVDFKLQSADSNLVPKPPGVHFQVTQQPILTPQQTFGEAIANFAGVFSGPGFNLIFRPQNVGSKSDKFPGPERLELNLTHETWTFPSDLKTGDLGPVPNRGVGDQRDIFLRGIHYVQVVRDVTGQEGKRIDVFKNGKAKDASRQKDITDIHFEPGLFVHIPASSPNPNNATISRMASIPHGTTINAQGQAATKANVPPVISPTDSTPFRIGDPKSLIPFVEFDINNQATTREPKDLSQFKSNGAITQDMLTNPNSLLIAHNAGKKILDTVTFTVKTTPLETPLKQQACPYLMAANTLNDAVGRMGTFTTAEATQIKSDLTTAATNLKAEANGTANIAFLDGGVVNAAAQPNASAAKVESTFWISRVQYSINVTADWQPGVEHGKPKQLRLFPSPTPNTVPQFVPDTVPIFAFPTDKPIKKGTYQCEAIQIQYSQNVLLNFNTLSWPHISVATLVPLNDIQVPAANIK